MKTATAARTVLAAAALFLAAAAAGAQGFGGGQGPGFGSHQTPMQRGFGPLGSQGNWWNHPRIVERLKLSDEQRKAMDAIMLQHREKLIDLRANLEKAELAMQPLMGADTPNDSAITAQIDKVVQARGDLERANARFLLAIRDKLNPDQWKQVQEFRHGDGMRGDFRQDRRQDGPRPRMQGQGRQFRPQPPPDGPQGAPATGAGQPPAPDSDAGSGPGAGPGAGDDQ